MASVPSSAKKPVNIDGDYLIAVEGVEGDRETCLAAGCTDYISKPLDGPRVVELIASYLKRQQNSS